MLLSPRLLVHKKITLAHLACLCLCFGNQNFHWQPKINIQWPNGHWGKKVNLEDFSCNHTSTDLVIKVFHFFFKMETDSALFMVIQILGKEFMFMAHQVIEDQHFKLPKMSCYLQFRQVFSSLIQQWEIQGWSYWACQLLLILR